MTALKKPSLTELIKKEQEYSLAIETRERKLREFNRQAEVQQNVNYQIERRARLAGEIDEYKLAYREALGYDYVSRSSSC